MNFLKYTVAFSLLVLLSTATFAQKKKIAKVEDTSPFKQKRVTCSLTMENTPQYSMSLGDSKGDLRTKWIKILGEFELLKETADERKAMIKSDGSTEKEAKAAPKRLEAIDEVKVVYELLYANGLDKSKRDDIYLKGTEDYVQLRRDTNSHKTKRIVSYVHPSCVEAHFPDWAKGGNISNYIIGITILDKAGNEVACGFDASPDMKTKYKLGSPINVKLARKALDSFAEKVKDKTISRRGTPFENVNFDYYEYLKPLPAQEK